VLLLIGILHKTLRSDPNTYPLSHFCGVCVFFSENVYLYGENN